MFKNAPRCYLLFGLLICYGCTEQKNDIDVTIMPGYVEKHPENVDASHENIAEMAEKSHALYENEKGFWEAELDEDHVMIYIPEGEFTMGTPLGEEKELPLHTVHLDGYWIGKFPVTVGQFRRFVNETGYRTDSENGEGSWIEEGSKIRYDVSWAVPGFEQKDNHPVICVSWNDAMDYSAWISEKTGLEFTLPTEAQWEKAARGIDQRIWPWGNEIPDGTRANFADKNYINTYGDKQRNPSEHVDDGYAHTAPVDAYPNGQSPYGVNDLAGNAIEWCFDWYELEYYTKSPVYNPVGPKMDLVREKWEIEGGWASNLQRSIRGGAWTDASGELSISEGGHSIRADMRERTDQYSSDDHLGFRIVIDYIERRH